jgi:hypothetical protein
MSDFDPAKEAINLAKHGISLAWTAATIMEKSDIAVTGTSTVSLTVWCLPTVMDGCGRSAFDARTIRK